jgi:hypothetical protein
MNSAWDWAKNDGSALQTLIDSALPSLESRPTPFDVKMTVDSALVKPDNGVQLPSAGTAKPNPMKVVPPLPNPPSTAMQ